MESDPRGSVAGAVRVGSLKMSLRRAWSRRHNRLCPGPRSYSILHGVTDDMAWAGRAELSEPPQFKGRPMHKTTLLQLGLPCTAQPRSSQEDMSGKNRRYTGASSYHSVH